MAPGIVARRCACLLAFVLALAAGTGVRADAPVSAENQVKAIFLFNFAQFVDWPEQAFSSDSAPIVIGVLGDNPFSTYLDAAVRGEKIGAHPLEVRFFRRVEDIRECHVLFISRSEAAQLETLLPRLKSQAVLTVGDTENFTRLGGMIRFLTVNNKVRLRVNVAAAKAAGLTISSKLLRPTMIVGQEGD
jgi:hypothetical protein